MKERYRIYQRDGGMFYAKDRKTGQRVSLATSDFAEAKRLLAAKNQATEQPCLNVAMAKVYLSAQSPEFLVRTWGQLIELMLKSYEGPTAKRWDKFRRSAPMRILANLPIYMTEASHLLAVLDHKKAGVSTNVWLRILHNRALDLGWLLAPVMPKRAWPKIQYRSRRAITIEEHEKIVAAERLADYGIYFKLLWETGGSQSDVVNLCAEDVDWSTRTLHYSRQKLANRGGGQASLAIGARLEALLRLLPSTGRLFPRLRLLGENMRAGHFCKLCKRAGIAGVSLHSYRYAWAERAYSAGMPEREAQAHLGHGSKAVHRAYAKRANVITLPLEEYEIARSKKLLIFRDSQNADGAGAPTLPAFAG